MADESGNLSAAPESSAPAPATSTPAPSAPPSSGQPQASAPATPASSKPAPRPKTNPGNPLDSKPVDAGAPNVSPSPGTAPEAPAGSAPQVPSPGNSGEPPAPWYSELQNLGFKDVRDEEDARRRMLEALKVQNERQHYLQQQYQQAEQYARAYAQLQQDPRWQAFQQQYAQPQAQQTPEGWWKAPEVDLALLNEYREQDPESKQWKWKPDAPLEYKQQVEQYQHHLRKWNEDLLTRPHEVLPQIIEHETRRLFDQWYQERSQEISSTQFAQEVVQRNSDWMFARDPVTQQPLTDPMGQPIYSPDGQRINQYVVEASQLGIGDPRARWKYAVQKLENDHLRQMNMAYSQGQTAQAVHEQKKLEHLQAAAQTPPSRAGSLPEPGTPQRSPRNRGLSGGERLRQNMAAQGQDANLTPV